MMPSSLDARLSRWRPAPIGLPRHTRRAVPPPLAATTASPAEPAPVLLRRILALAAPTTALALLQVASQLIETGLAARQGTAALAGWAVLLPFVLLLQQTSTGAMGGGVVAAVARALGGQRHDEARALVLHAVLIAVVAGLGFALVVSAIAAPMLAAVAGTAAAEAGAPYAWWLFGLGAVPMWLANTLASVLRGAGRHALAARTLALMWIGIPLASWLLAEPAGFGLAGLGAAYALVSWLAALVMAAVVQRGGAGFVPDWHIRPTRALFVRILAVGAVASALAAVANLTTIAVTAQLRHHGTAAVAAYGVAARLEFVVVPLAFGVGSALTALVGRAVGAGDWALARRIAWIGAALAFAVTGVLGLAVGFFGRGFARLFTHDAAVVAIAAQALAWTGPAFAGFGLGMAMYFASMGAGRMRWPVAAALARFGIAVGGGGWLANGLGLGIEGHFIGVALGISAYGVITAASVRTGVWPGAGVR
jgi:Na+-driven multidrug efflux pump